MFVLWLLSEPWWLIPAFLLGVYGARALDE